MDNQYMQVAISEAEKAFSAGEVPVGAVLVRGDDIIARGHNLTMMQNDMLAHAEMLVIRKGLTILESRRLDDCSLYVTLEPCSMCAGAILLARPKRIYFGAYDPRAGACGGRHDVLSGSGIEVYGGIMEKECGMLLQEFFEALRER